MLSDSFLTTVVQTGITGAGLVVAIYALIIPISRKMFIYWAKIARELFKLFEEQRKNLTPEAKSREFKRLKQSADAVKETKGFPKYLGVGVLVTFVLYGLSALCGSIALTDPAKGTTESDLVLVILFIGANLSFLLLGIFTIFDVYATMKHDYEKVKEKLEGVEDAQRVKWHLRRAFLHC